MHKIKIVVLSVLLLLSAYGFSYRVEIISKAEKATVARITATAETVSSIESAKGAVSEKTVTFYYPDADSYTLYYRERTVSFTPDDDTCGVLAAAYREADRSGFPTVW